MSNSPAASEKGPKEKALGILGVIAGLAIGTYAGFNILIPVVALGIVSWGATKLFQDDKKAIIPAVSVNTAHFLWLVVGLVLSRGAALEALGFDLVVYAIGLTWLLVKPSRGPLYLLGIYQLVSLGVNGYAFAEATFRSAEHKALLVHVLWRAMALFVMFKLFFILKKKAKTDTAVAPDTQQL